MLGIVRTFLICEPLLVLSVDEVVEDVMGWTCGTYGEEDKSVHVLVGKGDRKTLGKLVCGRILLKCKAKK
jgi:hypothetical protein